VKIEDGTRAVNNDENPVSAYRGSQGEDAHATVMAHALCRDKPSGGIFMGKERVLTQEGFDRLLAWLDPERQRAGERYESIRRRLIMIFTCRGCHEAEELADETINRVTFKLHELDGNYVGDPALYFYGVARNVHLEHLRKPKPVPPPDSPSDTEAIELEYDCLERCVEQLPASQRDLVLEYYREEKQAKIDHRRKLAERMGIAIGALRIRAHRIRSALQWCVEACMEQTAA